MGKFFIAKDMMLKGVQKPQNRSEKENHAIQNFHFILDAEHSLYITLYDLPNRMLDEDSGESNL